MFLERLVNGVEQRVAALGRRFLQTDPKTQLREDVYHVSAELVARRKAWLRCRAEIDAARNRINDNQIKAALLTGRIQTALANSQAEPAWRDALDLDKARRQLAEDQDLLSKQEQLCWSLELKVRFLTRRLSGLQEQLYRG